jgi:hypothetical protein
MIKQDKLMEVLNFYKAFANSFARNLVLTYNLTNRLKFRKVVDVRREKELDERRKNEKLDISEDHPIRKLLMRMRERHGSRLATTAAGTDLERGLPRYMPTSNSTNSVMLVDETAPNAVPNHRHGTTSPPRSPLDRRRSMIRGKTFDDDSETRRSARQEYANSKTYGSSYEGAQKSTTLGIRDKTSYRVYFIKKVISYYF